MSTPRVISLGDVQGWLSLHPGNTFRVRCSSPAHEDAAGEIVRALWTVTIVSSQDGKVFASAVAGSAEDAANEAIRRYEHDHVSPGGS